MKFLKLILTIICLCLTMVVTLATSKASDKRYSNNNEEAMENITKPYFTNYKATSNCFNYTHYLLLKVKTEYNKEYIKKSKIVETYGLSQNLTENSKDVIYNFSSLGFMNEEISILDHIESPDYKNNSCYRTKVTYEMDNEFSNRTINDEIKNQKKGYFAKLEFECYEQSRYLCSIMLEELEPIPFDELKK